MPPRKALVVEAKAAAAAPPPQPAAAEAVAEAAAPPPKVSVVHVDTRDLAHRPTPRAWPCPAGDAHHDIRRTWDAENPAPPQPEYRTLASLGTALACRRLGWAYRAERPAAAPENRHPSWVKLRWVLDSWDELTGIVCVLDSDAWIRDPEAFRFVVDDAFADPAVAFLGVADPPCREARAHAAEALNGGFLCFRAGDARVRAFFEAAYADPDHYAVDWPWEQACLCRELAEKAEDWARVLPVGVCNTPGGSHVAHSWYKDQAAALALDDLLAVLAADLGLGPQTGDAALDVDLVIARYDEDVSWVAQFVPHVRRVVVYNKGPALARYHPKVRVVDLPNAGREAHAYLAHLAAEYDDLAAVTVFAQGTTADHVSREELRGMVLRGEPRQARRGLDAPWSSSVMRHLGWTPEANHTPGALMQPAGMSLAKFFLRYVGDDLLPEADVQWWQNAIFPATRDAVRRRPRAAFEELRDLLAAAGPNPELAHYMERFWHAMLAA